MAKPQPIRIPSDDCVITVRGRDYRVHEGEWVDIIPITTVADARAYTILQQLQGDLEAAAGDEEAQAEITRIGSEQMAVLTASLAQRIVAWSWTDMHSNPLPQPAGNPEMLMSLSTAELFYLVGLNEESPLGKLNGSHDSDSISSATKSSKSGQAASRSSASGPNSSTARARTRG